MALFLTLVATMGFGLMTAGTASAQSVYNGTPSQCINLDGGSAVWLTTTWVLSKNAAGQQVTMPSVATLHVVGNGVYAGPWAYGSTGHGASRTLDHYWYVPPGTLDFAMQPAMNSWALYKGHLSAWVDVEVWVAGHKPTTIRSYN